ncbi:MAG: hypothetical protein M2R45_00378 [Verrucomicrobia subdivision 3 bacterium]|nr:hypothetical protein [Limisphaerales bacterium]MCS1412864.1 hypothetical protein [Limisphaerales bacterium]
MIGAHKVTAGGKHRAGMTLVELLVVIAVLGLLAALLLPGLGRTRERGRRAACLNNLKQIVTANLIYADEDDAGRLSPHERGAVYPLFHHNWLWLDAGVSPKLFYCPSTNQRYERDSALMDPFTGKPYIPDLSGPSMNASTTAGNSYQALPFYRNMENYWNGNTNWRDNSDPVPKTLNGLNSYRHRHNAFSLQGQVAGPSATWLFCDGDRHIPSGRCFYPDPENNHGQAGGNVAFADGGVRWVSRADYVYSHELSQDNNRTRPYPR